MLNQEHEVNPPPRKKSKKQSESLKQAGPVAVVM
jgi:hypothetical protein